MAANHPLAHLVLPACKRFPAQSAALFQATVDLSLAQQWKDVEVVELDECACAVIKGRPPKASADSSPPQSPPSFVYPMGLQQPTNLRQLGDVIKTISTRFPEAAVPSEPSAASAFTDSPAAPSTTTTIFLAMIEKDSSIVYYVLRNGIVSPKEVPE
ncbi:hypothetical protein C6P46_004205 [Rhodotorula mucilaginosa]|uniref:tRNA-splicing endonuclease subunit Sen15 domain-containing protein n=1 Tax=Rhodotorula mucilaginosa TaxID=5537 RepID=A0A9P7B5H7_RHOMI|nr:hypothetical protein C6P46_004205 [Rhodotorula mucilaginosa]